MANRLIKESIKHSSEIDELTYFEECAFYRLLVTVDDFGCYLADPLMLAHELFPKKELVKKGMMADALDKMEEIGLIERYTVRGEAYLHMRTWERHQRIRTSVHKYPMPEDGSPVSEKKQREKTASPEENDDVSDENLKKSEEKAEDTECEEKLNKSDAYENVDNVETKDEIPKSAAICSKLQQIAADCSNSQQVAANCSYNPILIQSNPNPKDNMSEKKSKGKNETRGSPVRMKMPMDDGTEYDVTAEMIEHYKELYQKADVESELRKMIGWLEGNPSRRKTKRGMVKFINAWLGRAQDDKTREARRIGKTVIAQQYTQREYVYDDSEMDREMERWKAEHTDE